ncbi:acyl-CoA carboxylase epsilon subunit [Agromyces sp. NPDC058484]|uniref:acyl-CoA carboxylase epsilon subunit n=1 Tax=Agromyces sp. NPDC058484 TaxID=3346524 RepID=UPI003653BBB2
MTDTRSGDTPIHADADAVSDARAADLRFLTRSVTHEEAAAVTAVVLAALEDDAGAASVSEPARDPWVQSGHALRSSIAVGPGAWTRSVR